MKIRRNNKQSTRRSAIVTDNSKSAIVTASIESSDGTKKEVNKTNSAFLDNGSPVAEFLKKRKGTKERQAIVDPNNPEIGGKNLVSKNDLLNFKDEHFAKTTIDALGYKGLTKDKDHYLILANEYNETVGFAEILSIGGKGLSDLPEEMMKKVVSKFINFNRVYLNEVTYIILPLPNDSKMQQRQWRAQLNKIENSLLHGNLSPREREQMVSRRMYISEKIERFRTIDLNLMNQGFAMMIHQKTRKELKSAVNLAKSFGQDTLNLTDLSEEKKEELLHRINNPMTVGKYEM